jgi:glutamyl-tRNA(Gln) amidotransferase subunit E
MPGPNSDGLLVGLEIHQQLALGTKLFCSCPPVKSDDLPYSFERRLRPAQSETGRVDPAAVFEYSKGRSNLYFWSPESSCLVEADEEPPHPLSREGFEAALLVAITLGSNTMDEIHVMRKIVIDGSNTGGFQRTAVVGLGGTMVVDGLRVGVQSITIEEDAARILGEDAMSRRFALDRLGVALVEIALDPIVGDPDLVGRVALHLGRVLRSTGRVARGLGTIRQDLNVSYAGGKVVEVKGVQKLNLLSRVVEYERKRQTGLVRLAEKLRQNGVGEIRCRTKDVSQLLGATSCGIIKQQLTEGGKVVCVSATGLAGLLGWEPEPGIRLGREAAEVARANSLGGIIHSDEFTKQGISESEEESLRNGMECTQQDGLVLVAGPAPAVDKAAAPIMERLMAATLGVPAETRAATDSGETRYMRPRPGSQRMYPETDIPNIEVTKSMLAKIAREVPRDWADEIRRLEKEFALSHDMALKLYDSESQKDFESLARTTRLEPSFVASVLVDLPSRLSREGVPEDAIDESLLAAAVGAVASGLVAKEAVPDIVKEAATKGLSIEQAIGSLGLRSAEEGEIRRVVGAVVQSRRGLIKEKGAAALSPLMGEVMKELRGKADGATVSRVLREAIAAAMGD